MGYVTYIEPSGAEHLIALVEGETVMEAAVRNGLPGIDADCGGACACATCHVHVDPAWVERLPPKSDVEIEMLQDFASNVRTESRLSCRLQMSEELDGLVVRLLASQR